MKMGSSKPWQDVLEKIIGKRNMCASGLLEYFKPLHEWLKTENEKNKEFIGWNKLQKGNKIKLLYKKFKISKNQKYK